MGLDFWSTVRGVRPADTLIRTLPKIAEAKRGVHQEIVCITDHEGVKELKDRLFEGWRVVTSFQLDNIIYVTVEKDRD